MTKTMITKPTATRLYTTPTKRKLSVEAVEEQRAETAEDYHADDQPGPAGAGSPLCHAGDTLSAFRELI
jgi:hypothetical protein